MDLNLRACTCAWKTQWNADLRLVYTINISVITVESKSENRVMILIHSSSYECNYINIVYQIWIWYTLNHKSNLIACRITDSVVQRCFRTYIVTYTKYIHDKTNNRFLYQSILQILESLCSWYEGQLKTFIACTSYYI